MYSWFERDKNYEKLFGKFNVNENVKLYHKKEFGITNTIDIISVEDFKNKTILSESKYILNNNFLLILFSSFLTIYLIFIYFFIKKNKIQFK